MIKRWISVVIVATLALTTVACGKGSSENGILSNGNTVTTEYSKDYVYREEIIDIDLGDAYVDQMIVGEDKIYVYGTIYHYPEESMELPEEGDVSTDDGIMPRLEGSEEIIEETTEGTEENIDDTEETGEIEEEATEEAVEIHENTVESVMVDEGFVVDSMYDSAYSSGYTENVIGVFDLNGNFQNQFSLETNLDQWIITMKLDGSGNINLLVASYGNYDLGTTDQYFIMNVTETGEENWRVNLGENLSEDMYYYPNTLLMNDQGQMVVTSNLGIEVYETDGTLTNQIMIEEEYGCSYFMVEDGSLVQLCWGDANQYLQTIDLVTGEISEKIEFPFNSYLYTYHTGYGYDLYLTDNYGVYGYNLGEETMTTLMNYIDSDINTYNLNSVIPVSEAEFYATYYGGDNWETTFAKFTKVPPDEVVEKEVLTMACMWLDSEVKKEVIRFNKTNDSYRITVVDYSTYNTYEDYTIGITRLNADIVSGNVPDILVTSQEIPVNNYISKGILADLNTFLEADSEYQKEDYLPSIMETFSVDGSLYQIVPKFNMFTIIGKAADVGTESGWTLDDLMAVMEGKSEDTQIFGDMNRSTVLYFCMMLCNAQYIDQETGVCSFNTDGFKQLLEFANTFPEEIEYDDTYWNSYETQFREGTTLLALTALCSFRDYNRYEKGYFGEEITIIGFPTENENGSSISYGLGFGISEKSKNQEGAWEFVRYFIGDEYQDNVTYNFPIKLSSLEKQEKLAQEKEFYIDELTGEKIEYEESYWLNETEIILESITQEKCDVVMDALNSLNQVMYSETDLMSIIEEEAEAYFSGQKSVDEVVDIIQSRAQIYVNESR